MLPYFPGARVRSANSSWFYKGATKSCDENTSAAFSLFRAFCERPSVGYARTQTNVIFKCSYLDRVCSMLQLLPGARNSRETRRVIDKTTTATVVLLLSVP